MSDSVQEAFELILPPFDKAVESELMWLDGGRQTGLNRLVETVVHHQHALVTGESGAGKTCVMRALRDALSPNDFRLVYLAHVFPARQSTSDAVERCVNRNPWE